MNRWAVPILLKGRHFTRQTPGPLDYRPAADKHDFMENAVGIWSQTDLAGHICRVYEPPSPSPYNYVVIYLHCSEAASLKGYPAFGREFDRYGLRVIEPVSGRSWWTDRIWPEFDAAISAEAYVLQHVLSYVAEHWNAKPPRLALLGISMGGQAVLRLAYKYPTVFPTVAAIAPAIDFQKRIEEGVDPGLEFMYRNAEEARQDTALLHIHPLNWPRNQFFCCDPTDIRWHDSADRLRMKLSSLGVPFECDLEAEAGGHSFQYACHMAPRAIGFIAERLEQERRRVV
ncbi:MAG TPA: alpha/beta hydrolase-fold protein [Lacipirellulaceae bacterium]|nr:alpha/beta hydrolase-fold protein [Lacipirellulaceae bacterium]